ncbi:MULTISPECIES: MGMT family protein [Arthrobacter]|uniref:MGMT family protein n=1 Tax=Arthrobacter TaxID=1663 RepID=UPI001C1E4CAB|nr:MULTISPECIES: MGMT family protein [Arthrobacter]
MRERVLDYEEAVLSIVNLIPAGKVLTYGDIAEILERGGPRQVGAVMSKGSADVPWWRVLRADGRLPQGLESTAVGHYREESTALRTAGRSAGADGTRVDLRVSRWNPNPAQQRDLQRIRAALAAGTAGNSFSPAGLSEADDGVGP